MLNIRLFPIPGWLQPVLLQCASLYLGFIIDGLVGPNACYRLHMVTFIGVHYSLLMLLWPWLQNFA